MLTTGPNRVDAITGRSRPARGSSESMPAGLALSQIVAGVMENWDEIEQDLPWNRAPQTDREPVRQQATQQATQSQRPRRPEEIRKAGDTETALAESEDLPLLGQPSPKAVKEVKAEAGPKSQEASGAEKGEALQMSNWRAPELPRAEGGGMPASFAVPNHSAGASGFGNTWSHVAKAAQPESLVLSE